MFVAAFELRDITRRDVEVASENRLAQLCLLANRFYVCAGDFRRRSSGNVRGPEVPHGDLVMRGLRQQSAFVHVLRRFQQLRGEPTGLCLFCFRRHFSPQ